VQIKDQKKTCFALIGIFLVISLCIGILRLSHNISYTSRLTYYDLDWEITINNRNYGKHRFSSFEFPPFERDSVIELVSTAPDLKKMEYTDLQIEIDDCAIEIYQDDDCVFSQNKERFKEHKYIGSGLLNVPLVNLKRGEAIKIILYANEKNAFKRLHPVKFTSLSDSYAVYVKQNFFIFVCLAFLLVLGLIGTILSFTLWTYKKQAMSLLVLAQLVFWSSMCLFCKHRFVQFFSMNFAFNTILAYVSLEIALICVFLLYYLSFANDDLIKKIYKIAIRWITILFTVLWILHFTDIWHLSKQIVCIRAFLIILGIYGFSVSCCILVLEPFVKGISALGFFLLCIFFIYDYLYYFVFFLTMGSFAFNRNNWFIFGIISLGVCIIIDFIFQLVNSATEDADIYVTEQSRSIDFVTGVLTRDAIIEKFKYFEKLNKNYTLVSFDFLNMPETSTKNGAETFYESISFLSGLIKHVFGIVSEIGRISDTGFIILSSEISEKRLQQMLLVFQNILNSDNNHNKDISVLVGSAFSNELKDCNCYSLYSLAQQRRSVLALNKRNPLKK